MPENLEANLVLEHALTPMKDTAAEAVANVEKRVKQYVFVRDQIKAMQERHVKELEDLKDIQEKLTGILQEALTNVGAESIKTSQGTVYSTTRYTASLQDPKAFMDFVLEKGLTDLLDRKANAPACRDYCAEHGVLPPGVNMSSIQTVGVRRASGK